MSRSGSSVIGIEERLGTADRVAVEAESRGPPTADYSPSFVRWFARLFWPFARIWFRPRVEGLEEMPPAPCLVTGNHSAYGIMEIFVLLTIWTRRFATRRPVVGLSHDVGLKWPLRWGVVRIGGVRASHRIARGALSRGFDVLAFPGGDVDALRPFSARYEVHWDGRSGFVRTAAEAGVPIVPIANCGSHAQFTLLPGGRTLAKLAGLNRFRIKTWPVPLGSLALLGAVMGWAFGRLSPWWILGGALCAFFPNPTRMHIRFLPPINARQLLAVHRGDAQVAAEAIRTQIEGAVREMATERKTPWG